jgi:TctA family transporter
MFFVRPLQFCIGKILVNSMLTNAHRIGSQQEPAVSFVVKKKEARVHLCAHVYYLACMLVHMLCFHAAMQASILDSCAHICSLNVGFLYVSMLFSHVFVLFETDSVVTKGIGQRETR